MLLAAGAGTLLAAAGGAQAQPFPSATPGAELRRHLETLARNPDSVQALLDAGRAALAAGDGAAALGFFTRASQLAPGNPRAKLGLAAAQARTGRPQNAIMLFSQAQAMGVPVGEIAGDRGLAYDLMGQPASAQQDYVAALRYREDPEVRRRLALSLAITGQREAALRVIGDQVRRGDRSALRTRAFVLALGGDAAGATEAARTSMPPGSVQAIAPFFQRLAGLSASQMASAVHLGRFPSTSGYRSAANSRPASDPGALAFAGGGARLNVALASRLPVTPPGAGATRRRPGAAEGRARRSTAARETRTLAAAASRPGSSGAARRTIERWDLAERSSSRAMRAEAPAALPNPVAQARSGPVGSPVAAAAALLLPHPHQPLHGLGAGPASSELSMAPANAPEPVMLADAAATRIPEATPPAPSPDLAAAAAEPTVELVGAGSLAVSAPPASPAASADPVAAPSLAGPPAPAAPSPRTEPAPAGRAQPAFADVAAAISALPAEAEPAPAGPAENRREASAQRQARPPQAANPTRIWVQLASAPRASLPGELNRLRRIAPALLRSRSGFTARLGASNNRLLVGPFATAAEARTLVNRLKDENISAYPWTSDAGQEVERLPAGR